MAAYDELYNLRTTSTILDKVSVAVTKKAQALIDLPSPTANQLTWADKALTNPVEEARVLFNYVLAVNSSATVAQINAATDTAIQDNVNAAVDKLIAGGVV